MLGSTTSRSCAFGAVGVKPVLTKPDAVPLWKQLQATAKAVLRVSEGMSGSAAIDAVEPALKPGVQALAFYVWRNWGKAKVLCQLLTHKKPAPQAHALLCTALALASQQDDVFYDAHTLVDQAVEAAKRQPQTRAQAGFINACLRRFLRSRAELVSQANQQPEALYNHPLWWIRHLQNQYPDDWQRILTASNEQAPMTLRVNQRKINVENYLQTLQQAHIAAHPMGGSAVVLEKAIPVQQLPGFATGQVSVQDKAAQQAAELLLQGMSIHPAMRILDACAAPGGKTGHLLELADAHVLALDQDSERCKRIVQNMQRLQLQAEVRCADAGRPDTWWNGDLFDAILLDAPCTASGIVRRHPDVRWLRRQTDIEQLAKVQYQLLTTLWSLLKPGGRLLYCTCSVFKEEGELQAQTFLANNTNALMLPSPGHYLPRSYDDTASMGDNRTDHDGFYYALFQKQVS